MPFTVRNSIAPVDPEPRLLPRAVNASYNLFSAGAKNNSASIDEYREKHCSLSEDDVAALVTENFRERSVNPAVVAAWSACRGQTGIRLAPELDENQKVASFSITYDARRLPAVPTLRGINAPQFSCQNAGSGEEIGVGGGAIELSPTEAVVVRCDRDYDTEEINGRPVTVYRDASLILDLSTGGHRIDFAERREGPAVQEFAALQERVGRLDGSLSRLDSMELRVDFGPVEEKEFDRVHQAFSSGLVTASVLASVGKKSP